MINEYGEEINIYYPICHSSICFDGSDGGGGGFGGPGGVMGSGFGAGTGYSGAGGASGGANGWTHYSWGPGGDPGGFWGNSYNNMGIQSSVPTSNLSTGFGVPRGGGPIAPLVNNNGWMSPSEVASYNGPTNTGIGSRGVINFGMSPADASRSVPSVPSYARFTSTPFSGGVAASNVPNYGVSDRVTPSNPFTTSSAFAYNQPTVTDRSTLQSNPLAQQISGKVGGTISGPANPYNNGQFVQQSKPSTVFDALQSAWNSVFNTMGVTGKVGGFGLVPGGKSTTKPWAAPDSFNVTKPVTVTDNPNPMKTLPARTLPPPQKYTDPTFELLQSAMNQYRQAMAADPDAKVGVIPGMDTIPDTEIMAAARFAKGVSLIVMDKMAESQGRINYISPDGRPYADKSGNILHAPIIDNQQFNQLGPVEKSYFFNKYNPVNVQLNLPAFRDSALESRGMAATAKLSLIGVPQQVQFASDIPFNFTYADMLSKVKDNNGVEYSGFVTKLLNDGYSLTAARSLENKANQMIWGDTPENISGDSYSNYFIGPTRGQPYFTISLPGVPQTMTFEAYTAYVTNLENAVQNSGAILNIQGSKFESGDAIAMLERMSRGNMQIVPEVNAAGQYTGELDVMTREYGVAPKGGTVNTAEAGSPPPTSDASTASLYTQMIGTSGWPDAVKQFFIKSDTYSKIVSMWKAAAPTTPFSVWAQSFDWQKFYTDNASTGSTSSYKSSYYNRPSGGRRLRSVSY